jgi:hypothetical protein
MTGCADYPLNRLLQQTDPEFGYRGKDLGTRENSKDLLLLLSFSGGGTRAAAFGCGLLEQRKNTIQPYKESLTINISFIYYLGQGNPRCGIPPGGIND